MPADGDDARFPKVADWTLWKELPTDDPDGEPWISISGEAIEQAIADKGYWIGAHRGRIRVG